MTVWIMTVWLNLVSKKVNPCLPPSRLSLSLPPRELDLTQDYALASCFFEDEGHLRGRTG